MSEQPEKLSDRIRQADHGLSAEDLRELLAEALPRVTLSETPINLAIWDIAMERLDQTNRHGFTFERDDQYVQSELSKAAEAYLVASRVGDAMRGNGIRAPAWWPWSLKWWKPSTKRQDLVKAGALVVAEIERIDRASKKEVRS